MRVRAPLPAAMPSARRRGASPLGRLGIFLALLSALAAGPSPAQASSPSAAAAPAPPPPDRSFSHGPFGKISVYLPPGQPTGVVLFASGDGGWNKGVIEMARHLAAQGAAVAGFDMARYMTALRARQDCIDLASDLDGLAKKLEEFLALPAWLSPILAGYSSGATLVYAALVQAPPGTFAGGLSLGFSPRLAVARTFCAGYGLRSLPYATKAESGVAFKAVAALKVPWILLQGTLDEVADPGVTEAFVRDMAGARLELLPGVGHGFGATSLWAPVLTQAYREILASVPAAATAADIKGLPLVELPAAGGTGSYLIVMLSGDGGWANIDRSLGEFFASRGVPVVGLDSLSYFWIGRDPDILAADLGRIIAHYRAAWGRDRVLLAGYSLGAEVLPFAARRLAPELKSAVQGVVLIAPGDYATFQFHPSDWLAPTTERRWPVLPEIRALGGGGLLLISGRDEKGGPAALLRPGEARVSFLPGGHHFNGDYAAIARLILEAWPP